MFIGKLPTIISNLALNSGILQAQSGTLQGTSGTIQSASNTDSSASSSNSSTILQDKVAPESECKADIRVNVNFRNEAQQRERHQ